VPTLADRGLPNCDMEGWIALIAPAGVQQQVVDKVHADVRSALQTKAVQEAMAQQGMTPRGTAPEATAQLFRQELARYATIVRESGATLE
jgi:tripartite-type tricarboxylate transporter receptor subunit TctC